MKSRLPISVGSWKVSVTTLAWGLSVILHGGLLTASYYATWRPETNSNPDISFAKGEQASRVLVRLIPWPIPAIEDESLEEVQEEPSTHEENAINIDLQEVETIPSMETPSSEMTLNPSVTKAASPNQHAVHDLGGWPVNKIPVTHDDSELALKSSLVENLLDTQSQPQPVSEIISSPVKQTERIISTPRPKEKINRSQLREATASDDIVAKKKSRPTPSEKSTPQTVGVETGVETLNLTKPRYPSLSRRQGEHGLVWLLVEVLADGSVGEVVVLQDAGFRRLAQAAIAAVRKGHFKPATRDGRAVKDTVRIPFRFVLN